MKTLRPPKTTRRSVFRDRREKIYDWMSREGIALLAVEDTEGRRDPSLRWLSGLPSDGILFLSVERHSLLTAWDLNLASIHADAEHLLPYSDFKRRPLEALRSAAAMLKIPSGSRMEISPATPYPLFLDYVGNVGDFDVLCRREGAWQEMEQLRALKDEGEIALIRKGAEATNSLLRLLEKQILSGKIKTEADAALLIEAECRKLGCEGTGFETLAAGPERSFAIHSFPPYTASPFGSRGLSILDFGLRMGGYSTDVTMTIARDCSPAQEKIVSLTEKAYDLALSMVKNGESTRNIAAAVDRFFARSKQLMPHALGHGIGLEEHEQPSIRNRDDNQWVLAPGMIFTLEPGLYDPLLGGCRLENDILLGEKGPEVLTEAQILRL